MPREGTLLWLAVTAVGPAEQDTMANPGARREIRFLALEVVDALERFEVRLDGALSNLI